MSDINQLSSLAKIHNKFVISRVEDIPMEVWLTDIDAQQAMNEITDRQVLLSERGVIYTCSRDPRHIYLAEKLLGRYLSNNKYLSSANNVVRIQPCSEQVIAQIVRAQTQTVVDQNAVSVSGELDRSRAQKFLDTLIDNAVLAEATDIHIDVNMRTSRGKIQFRVFGLLRIFKDHISGEDTWPSDELLTACSAAINSEAASNNSTTKSFNTREIIDASFLVNTSDKRKKIRYAQTPTLNGFKVVMRILPIESDSKAEVKSFRELGYLDQHAQIVEQASQAGSGLVLVSGPTGSGKSTTLNVMMEQFPSHKSIYTYEDPIEYELSNATQVPVLPGSDNQGWQALSKNSLRMDPDIIMFGELRDHHVASEIVNAAMTGHLVLTTLHTNSAVSCVTRLNDLDISYRRLAEPGMLRALVFQRLLPETCPDCSISASEYTSDKTSLQNQMSRMAKYFGDKWSSVRIANTDPHDCHTCGGSGIVSRVLIAEAIDIDEKARSYIANADIDGWLKYLASSGWLSLRDHAEKYVIEGRACPAISENVLSERFELIL